AASPGRAIEVAVRTLHQGAKRGRPIRAVRLAPKDVQRGQTIGCRVNLVDRAAAFASATRGCSVKVPIGALDKPAYRLSTVGAVGQAAEFVDRAERSAGRDREYRTAPSRSANVGCPIDFSVACLYQTALRLAAISAVCLAAKAIQPGKSSAWSELEYRAIVGGPAKRCCPVKV